MSLPLSRPPSSTCSPYLHYWCKWPHPPLTVAQTVYCTRAPSQGASGSWNPPWALHTRHSSCHRLSICQEENVPFSNSNKETPFGLMAALTLPEMEELLPSLQPFHPSPHSHQLWWVFSLLRMSGIRLPPPLLTLTPSGLVPHDVRWNMMCPWLRSPTLLLVPQPQNRPSFVNLSNSHSCCTTPLKRLPIPEKSLPRSPPASNRPDASLLTCSIPVLAPATVFNT